ncbi:MAG: hypothetical protein P8Y02_13110 [Deinococcales bacterium]
MKPEAERQRAAGPRRARRALALLAAVAIWTPARAADPVWLADVRAAAFERARAPLADEALDAARLEVQRAAAGTLPRLRLHERARIGPDGAYGVTLDAGVALPLVAPVVPADGRVAAVRLAITERQVAAQRRADVRDTLARAIALLATEGRLRALDELGRALPGHALHARRRPRPNGGAPPPGAPGSPTPAAPPPDPAGSSTRSGTAIDARLLVSGRDTQLREARRLRSELTRTLDVALPAVGHLAPPTARARTASRPRAAPLGFAATDLEVARCLAASDAVRLAVLTVHERAASARLEAARSATRIDLELGGTLRLADGADAEGAARVALSVRLPPWSPLSGAASLAGGVTGLEQEATLVWPNRTPAREPAEPADDAILEAQRTVRTRLGRLQGEEADLLRRRRILQDALSALADRPVADHALPGTARAAGTLASSTRLGPGRASTTRAGTTRAGAPAAASALEDRALENAYLRARLRLRLTDVDQALGLNALDAALLCGALPP